MSTSLRKVIGAFVLLSACSLHAQQSGYLHLRDSVNRKDTVLSGVSFKYMTATERQMLVRASLEGEEEVKNYTPEQLVGYQEDGVRYDSRRLVQEGGIRNYLLPRAYQEDSIIIYKLWLNDKEKVYYFSVGDSTSLLVPMQRSRKRGGNSAAQAFLLSFPAAEDKSVQDYIASMKPTPGAFDSRYTVVKRGNPNYISRFRWGVQAGVGAVSLSGKGLLDKEYEAKSSFYAGLFFDVPIAVGMSLHPELSFQQYAFSYDSGKALPRDFITYNRRDLTLPILFRYTFCSLRGKVLPFVQLGPKVDFALKREVDGVQLIKKENINGWNGNEWQDKTMDYDHVDKTNIGLVGGVGVEWKCSFRHSLFIDLRYNTDFMDERVSGLFMNVAFNL